MELQGRVDYYVPFLKACENRGILPQMGEARYLEMRDEFMKRNILWWKEVQKCLDWLYDHKLKVLNLSRLRNWMNKSIEIAKSQERQALDRVAAKRENGFHVPLYQGEGIKEDNDF